MKKIMTVFIVVCLLLQSGFVFAASGAQVTAMMNTDTLAVEISGSGFGSMSGVFLAVVPKDIPLNRALQYNEFVFSDQPITDANGKFEVHAMLKSGTLSGTYTVYAVDGQTAKQVTAEFIYTSTQDYTTILQKFNEDVTNATQMKSALDTYGKDAMGDISAYTDTPAAQQDIANMLFSLRGTAFADIAALRQAYKTAVLLGAFSYAEDAAEFLNTYGTVLPTDVLDTFGALTSAQQSAAADFLQGKQCADIASLSSAMPEAVFVGKANTATLTDDLKQLFMTDYTTELNLDLTDYNNVVNKTTVFTKLLNLTSPRFTGFTDAKSKFETAAHDVLGSGGGGSGSGFGGGTAAGAPQGSGTYVPSANENQVTAKQYYNDLGSVAWAVTYINDLTELGVISGDGDGSFRPNNTVTRAEFVKMVVSAFRVPSATRKTAFQDVTDQWFAPYVASAVEYELVKGISSDRFGAEDKITRQDLTVICYRAALWAEMSLDGYVLASPTDSSKVAEYANEAVNTFYAAGIVSGDENGAFNPTDHATRAEAAKILSGLLDLKGGY